MKLNGETLAALRDQKNLGDSLGILIKMRVECMGRSMRRLGSPSKMALQCLGIHINSLAIPIE